MNNKGIDDGLEHLKHGTAEERVTAGTAQLAYEMSPFRFGMLDFGRGIGYWVWGLKPALCSEPQQGSLIVRQAVVSFSDSFPRAPVALGWFPLAPLGACMEDDHAVRSATSTSVERLQGRRELGAFLGQA